LIYGNYITGVEEEVPTSRRSNLANYPNPFNPRTILRFELSHAGRAQLAIHDLRGRVVRHLTTSRLSAGPHELVWDGTDDQGGAVASGQYFARLQIDGAPAATRKLLLVR